jgi:6,7-dimethyl-8-ribityllumazine synthase
MKNIAIVLGSFHKDHMPIMLEAARAEAKAQGLNIQEEVWVPGSMEKPIIIKKLMQRPDIDGIAVLGIIEKGETKHGFVMADAVIKAIINLQLEFMKPMGVGIIGPDVSPSQIPARVEPYGKKAVSALAEMFKVLK